MSAPPAPAGTRLVADAGLRRIDGGRLLVGGSPLRIIRLSARGSAVVDGWLAGSPVGDGGAESALARRLLEAGMVHPVVAPAAAADVTVVVPVRDDVDGLRRCLPSVGGHPVVVVDDGSTDGAAIRQVAEAHGAVVRRRAVSGGPGVARDDAAADLTTPFVAFLDADVEAAPGWIEALAGHFADPAVAAVAPRVRSRPGPTFRERYEEVHSPLDLGDAPSAVGPGGPVAYVPTAALVLRTAAFREVGGFDSALRLGEDVDLVWRLVDAGHTVRYEPTVVVHHEPRESWRAWFAQRHGYGTSAAPLATRHGRKVAPARCSVWSAAVWGAAAARHPFVGAGIAAGTTAALARRLEGVPDPVREAVRLAGPGHLHAGLGLARAVSRVWWPIAAVGATVRPRLRAPVLAALVVPAAREWLGGRRPADPVRSIAVRVLDDMAYGSGVWRGMARERSLAAIAPELVEWPGRRPAVEAGTVGTP